MYTYYIHKRRDCVGEMIFVIRKSDTRVVFSWGRDLREAYANIRRAETNYDFESWVVRKLNMANDRMSLVA